MKIISSMILQWLIKDLIDSKSLQIYEQFVGFSIMQKEEYHIDLEALETNLLLFIIHEEKESKAVEIQS